MEVQQQQGAATSGEAVDLTGADESAAPAVPEIDEETEREIAEGYKVRRRRRSHEF
jgi:hypothetical protein